jgi:hypothetical protein
MFFTPGGEMLPPIPAVQITNINQGVNCVEIYYKGQWIEVEGDMNEIRQSWAMGNARAQMEHGPIVSAYEVRGRTDGI